MPLDTSIYADDLTNMIADLPAYFRWNGKTVPCAAVDQGVSDTLEDTAVSRTRNVTLIMRRDLLTTVPEQDKPCQFQYPGSKDWLNFFIDNVNIDDDNQGLTIRLRANQKP